MGMQVDQHSFARGKVSGKAAGRPDMEFYYSALQEAKNYVITPLGAVEKRPGTCFVCEVPDEACLIPFIGSARTGGGLVLIATEAGWTFAQDGQKCLDGAGNPISFDAGLTFEQIKDLEWTQTTDKMYFASNLVAPFCLTRTGEKDFVLEEMDLQCGPYGDINTDEACTIALNTDGTIVQSPDCDPFDAARDVGRWLRVYDETTGLWCDVQIDTVVDGQNATFINETGELDDLGDPVLKVNDPITDWLWRLSVFYPGNYPETVELHQNRLFFASTIQEPLTIWASEVGNYTSFCPSSPVTTVNDDGTTTTVDQLNPDNAISLTIQEDQDSQIRWLLPYGQALMVGTDHGLHMVQPVDGAGWQPGQQTVFTFAHDEGTADIEPVMIQQSVVYVDRTKKQVHYTVPTDGGGVNVDRLDLLAEDMTCRCITETAFQKHPHNILWQRTGDGGLIGATYMPSQRVNGWHEHCLGGTYIENGCAREPFIEDIEVVPGQGESTDDFYLLVKRTINGRDVRFLEMMKPFYKHGDTIEEAQFLDASITHTGDPAGPIGLAEITADATTLDPGALPASDFNKQSLAFHDGQRWFYGKTEQRPDGTVEFTLATPNMCWPPIAGQSVWRADVCDPWQEYAAPECMFDDSVWVPKDAQVAQIPCIREGIERWSIGSGTICGLDHLEGENITALIDGKHPKQCYRVTDGCIDIGFGHVVIAGFPYRAEGETMPPRPRTQRGQVLCENGRVEKVCIRVACSAVPEIVVKDCAAMNEQFEVTAKADEDQKLNLPGLPFQPKSGTFEVNLDATDNRKTQIAFREDRPLPSCIVGITSYVEFDEVS